MAGIVLIAVGMTFLFAALSGRHESELSIYFIKIRFQHMDVIARIVSGLIGASLLGLGIRGLLLSN